MVFKNVAYLYLVHNQSNVSANFEQNVYDRKVNPSVGTELARRGAVPRAGAALGVHALFSLSAATTLPRSRMRTFVASPTTSNYRTHWMIS